MRKESDSNRAQELANAFGIETYAGSHLDLEFASGSEALSFKITHQSPSGRYEHLQLLEGSDGERQVEKVSSIRSLSPIYREVNRTLNEEFGTENDPEAKKGLIILKQGEPIRRLLYDWNPLKKSFVLASEHNIPITDPQYEVLCGAVTWMFEKLELLKG